MDFEWLKICCGEGNLSCIVPVVRTKEGPKEKLETGLEKYKEDISNN